MTTTDSTNLKSDFETISKGAYLDVLIPRSADFDAARLLRDGFPEAVARAPTRRNLFFGNVLLPNDPCYWLTHR